MRARKALEQYFYQKNSLSTMHQGLSHLQRRITRILNVRLEAALSIMEKFHYFLYGRKFILRADQKPLVSIFRKHMIHVSPRIQRITIRAWQYDFVPQHIPGTINVIADSLSTVTPLEFQDSNGVKGYSSSELATVLVNR